MWRGDFTDKKTYRRLKRLSRKKLIRSNDIPYIEELVKRKYISWPALPDNRPDGLKTGDICTLSLDAHKDTAKHKASLKEARKERRRFWIPVIISILALIVSILSWLKPVLPT